MSGDSGGPLGTTEGLSSIPDLRQIGTAADKVNVLSFVIPGVESQDIGSSLDKQGGQRPIMAI